jgi:hypothetical protein
LRKFIPNGFAPPFVGCETVKRLVKEATLGIYIQEKSLLSTGLFAPTILPIQVTEIYEVAL